MASSRPVRAPASVPLPTGAKARRLRDASARGSDAGDRALAFNGVIHHRVRLGIVSALAGADVLTFNELKSLLQTTDGNLSVHARKLEDAGYIDCRKSFEDRRPRTDFRLTAAGRKALQSYLDHMEALIEATRDTLER